MNDSDMYRAGIPLNVKGTPYVRTLPLPVKALRACERCVFGRGEHKEWCRYKGTTSFRAWKAAKNATQVR